MFDAVWNAGQKYGLKPMGLEALDMVRIEAGLIFAHYEFDSETDPFEAGIGFAVPLKTKGDDFIGKEALIKRKEHPRRKLVGLEIDSNEAVGHGDCVHIGRAQVGVVTSSMRSPILGKNIALARVDALNVEVTEAQLDERGDTDGEADELAAAVDVDAGDDRGVHAHVGEDVAGLGAVDAFADRLDVDVQLLGARGTADEAEPTLIVPVLEYAFFARHYAPI